MQAASGSSSFAGQVIADRWRLEALLGEGSMGEVWRARHTALGHEAAVKILKEENASNPELCARFRREARIAAHLRHRNLVRVEDLGASADGRPFMAMELLRGHTLAAILADRTRFDPATTLHFASQIAMACDAAHAAGIVHRDLKPENCLVLQDEEGAVLKVLDFGMAKISDRAFVTQQGVVTGSHALLGTPMYMSPEQARGLPDLDGRSDFWSLGIMVYQMLSGRVPWPSETFAQLLFSILAGPLPSLSAAGFPHAEPWLARALHRDRAQRFSNGREFTQALGEALGLGPVSGSWRPPPMNVAIAPAGALPASVPASVPASASDLPPAMPAIPAAPPLPSDLAGMMSGVPSASNSPVPAPASSAPYTPSPDTSGSHERSSPVIVHSHRALEIEASRVWYRRALALLVVSAVLTGVTLTLAISKAVSHKHSSLERFEAPHALG